MRQLRNVIDSAVVLAGDEGIKLSDLGLREAVQSSLESLRIDHWEEQADRRSPAPHRRQRARGGQVARYRPAATLYYKVKQYGLALDGSSK